MRKDRVQGTANYVACRNRDPDIPVDKLSESVFMEAYQQLRPEDDYLLVNLRHKDQC